MIAMDKVCEELHPSAFLSIDNVLVDKVLSRRSYEEQTQALRHTDLMVWLGPSDWVSMK